MVVREATSAIPTLSFISYPVAGLAHATPVSSQAISVHQNARVIGHTASWCLATLLTITSLIRAGHNKFLELVDVVRFDVHGLQISALL